MKRIVIVLAAALLTIGFSLLAGGCAGPTASSSPTILTPVDTQGPPPWAPAHGYRAKHHYRYYPDSRVYFDLERSVYFYYGGSGWQMSASLPSAFDLDMRGYVDLDMDEDRPYLYHSEVIKRYPAGHGRGRGHGRVHNSD